MGDGKHGRNCHRRSAARRRRATGRTADRHRGRRAPRRPAAPVRGGRRDTRGPPRGAGAPGRLGDGTARPGRRRRGPTGARGRPAAGVVLVGRDQDDSGVWRRAVEIGADHVLMLPDGEQWLVDRIADVAEGVGRPALTVGVIGGRGGAGASTLACALAVTSAREGLRTLLVDADPLGGGLDVLLGGETAEGLRWPAFAASRGRVGGGALEESLPELHSLRVLSWDRGDCVAIPRRRYGRCSPPPGGAAARSWSTCPAASTTASPRPWPNSTWASLWSPPNSAPSRRPAASRPPSAWSCATSAWPYAARTPPAPDDREVARLLALPLAGEVPVESGLLRPHEGKSPPGTAGGPGRWRGSAGSSWSGRWSRRVAYEGAGGGAGAEHPRVVRRARRGARLRALLTKPVLRWVLR